MLSTAEPHAGGSSSDRFVSVFSVGLLLRVTFICECTVCLVDDVDREHVKGWSDTVGLVCHFSPPRLPLLFIFFDHSWRVLVFLCQSAWFHAPGNSEHSTYCESTQVFSC